MRTRPLTFAALLTLVSALALAGTAVAAQPGSPGPLDDENGKLVTEPFPPGQGPPRLKEQAAVDAFLRSPKVADWIDQGARDN